MSAGTFTLGGDPRAEGRVRSDLARIASAVEESLGARLRALVLVGGYARGEGSVVARDGELGPYNDYDLVAVVAGGAHAALAPLARLGHALAEGLGVEVDLWPLAERDLEAVPPTLFWLDVGLGAARVIAGDEGVLARLRRHEPRAVPLEEVGRLLANRAVGLALTNLERDRDRDLRRARHGHKAVLACGDARLLAAHRYRGTFAARVAEVEHLAGAPDLSPELARAYADAARFRARPDLWSPTGEDLAAWYARTLALVARAHLSFEAWRVGAPEDLLAAGRFTGRFYPELPDVRRGGAALSSLRAALRHGMPIVPWVGHPRERLARVALLLAYGADRPEARALAARLIGLGSSPHTDDALHTRLVELARLGG